MSSSVRTRSIAFALAAMLIPSPPAAATYVVPTHRGLRQLIALADVIAVGQVAQSPVPVDDFWAGMLGTAQMKVTETIKGPALPEILVVNGTNTSDDIMPIVGATPKQMLFFIKLGRPVNQLMTGGYFQVDEDEIRGWKTCIAGATTPDTVEWLTACATLRGPSPVAFTNLSDDDVRGNLGLAQKARLAMALLPFGCFSPFLVCSGARACLAP